MKSSVHMYELDSFTYRAAAHDEGRVLLIPVGAIEQHGPHMSMNVDVLLPLPGRHNIANALAATSLAMAVGADLAAVKAGLAQLQAVAAQRIECLGAW